MKLELKHIKGYLDTGLEMMDTASNRKWKLNIYHFSSIGFFDKPILRPLSDLTKEIEVNGEKFVPVEVFGYEEEITTDFIFKIDGSYYEITEMPFDVIQKLLEWHFDIYGLIEANLAIDINTLK